ncbi:hypothetical protein [Streptomyces sp. NPDC051776]|uniref:hypothetical protein n=1 Tax=Streptomyces sp. NPDC051776 TaxID=3155414 RepID=UPI00343EA5D3
MRNWASAEKRSDDRTVLNGFVWKFRTGHAALPLRRRANGGTFERLFQAAQAKADAAGDID